MVFVVVVRFFQWVGYFFQWCLVFFVGGLVFFEWFSRFGSGK